MRLEDLQGVRRIEDIPFGGILWDAGKRPVLFDSIVPGLDLMIWNAPQPGAPEATTTEIREAALLTLTQAVENADTPGAVVHQIDGCTMFAFDTADRNQMIAEMGIEPLLVRVGA